MPGVFQHPACAPGGKANPKFASLAAGKNADSLAQMRFQIKVIWPLKKRVERDGPQESIELEMANAILPGLDFVRGGDDVETTLVKDDCVGLDFSLPRVLAGRLILDL